MTTVVVYKNNTGLTGFSVSGHAGYDEEGYDIVCASASVLITTCANALETVVKVIREVNVSEAHIEVKLPKKMTDVEKNNARIVLATTLQGFKDIATSYPDYFTLKQ